MMAELSRIPFSNKKIEDALSFAKANPWQPIWPEEQMRRFLSQFVSNEELVFDLWSGVDHICIAVLLDKVLNPGNFANLEVLGFRQGCDPTLVIDKVLFLAKKSIPFSQAGFQIGFHNSMVWSSGLIPKHGLEPYYETFEMLNENISHHAQASKEFRLATAEDDVPLYQVLTEAFRENPDTSIPEFDDWRKSRRSSNSSRTWLAEVNNKIVGFLTLAHSPSQKNAEIRTVGILQNMRGRGYGKALIKNAFHHLLESETNSCELTVAVQNKNALRLYENLGFKRGDHYLVYKWQK